MRSLEKLCHLDRIRPTSRLVVTARCRCQRFNNTVKVAVAVHERTMLDTQSTTRPVALHRRLRTPSGVHGSAAAQHVMPLDGR
jgi:hypothetical protein